MTEPGQKLAAGAPGVAVCALTPIATRLPISRPPASAVPANHFILPCMGFVLLLTFHPKSEPRRSSCHTRLDQDSLKKPAVSGVLMPIASRVRDTPWASLARRVSATLTGRDINRSGASAA